MKVNQEYYVLINSLTNEQTSYDLTEPTDIPEDHIVLKVRFNPETTTCKLDGLGNVLLNIAPQPRLAAEGISDIPHGRGFAEEIQY